MTPRQMWEAARTLRQTTREHSDETWCRCCKNWVANHAFDNHARFCIGAKWERESMRLTAGEADAYVRSL